MLKTRRCDPSLFRKDLKGRVYIVTGANSGAGLGTMSQLVRQGAHVVAATASPVELVVVARTTHVAAPPIVIVLASAAATTLKRAATRLVVPAVRAAYTSRL